MSEIKTSRADVIWNYIGTIVSMSSGFLLLPLLLRYLTADELGLWYVYLAVSNLTQLFEFGFNPTFARNIVYCLSGAKSIKKRGAGELSSTGEVDWHLFKSLMTTSKIIYAVIAVLALIVVSTLGSLYISGITSGMEGTGHWASWAVFCLSIFINLYFLYSMTFLRGVGDIAGENRSKTYAKIAQLVSSAVLLVFGFGLLGASIGFLVNGLVMRVFAGYYYSKHADISLGIRSDNANVTRDDVRGVLAEVSSIAWRDGVVQIALYASTQATSIISSLFLGLAETGMYSVLLQLGTAVYNFAGAFVKSYYPMFQSSFAKHDVHSMLDIVKRGISAYWMLCAFGAAGIILVIFPLLPIVKPGVEVSVPFFLFLTLYLSLLNHHSIFCNFIIGMNEIPYMKAYLFSAVLGVIASAVLCGVFHLGAWGLVAGQAASQLIYNNWKWPQYVMKKLGFGYFEALKIGCRDWLISGLGHFGKSKIGK